MATDGSKQWRVEVPPPPRTLNVQKFAESRAVELESLHSIVANRLTNDYRSRRNKRRRTTGFDNRCANNRHRKRQKSAGRVDLKKSETGDKLKKLPRRIRRRIELQKNPECGFCNSGDGTKRLRTHVWHAKRFTMTKLWGFYLPLGLHGRGRGSRALLKWYKQGAVVHDASYYSAVQLAGPEDLLLSILDMVLTPSPAAHAEDVSKHLLAGDAYGSAILHHDSADSQIICPVTYMWRPFHQQVNDIGAGHTNSDGNNEKLRAVCPTDKHQLWIWIHPSAFGEGYAALKSACQAKADETGVTVDFISLEGQLARLEVMGSKALQLLKKILNPITCFSEDSWQLKKCSVVGGDNSNESRQRVLQKEDCISSHAVVPLIVADPRSLRGLLEDKTKEQSVSTGGLDRNEGLSALQSKPAEEYTSSNCKDLWDVSKGIHPPLEESVLCMERHHRRLDFFCIKDKTFGPLHISTIAKCLRLCPIILLRNTSQAGSLQGWSIILPLSWVKAFWIPLISAGAHAVGLREKHWIACDVGLPDFPSDFPDSRAYSHFKETEAAAINRKMGLRPPAVRPLKVPNKPPWNSIYFAFEKGSPQVNEAHSSSSIASDGSIMPKANGEITDISSIAHNGSLSIFVARTSNMLSEFLNEIPGGPFLLFPYGPDGKSFSSFVTDEMKISQASNMVPSLNPDKRLCYVRVRLHAYREGVFEEGAVVCAPYFSDIALWTSRSENNEAKLQIPQPFMSSYFIEQSPGNWEFQLPDDPVARESYRRPIGFVTTGSVRGSKKPAAVALCVAVLLAQLRQDQWSQMPVKRRRKEIYVLTRNLRSTAFRLALATIVIEGQEEDVEYI
ncbi:hypothetical protein Nepgr_004141 [Nepenthes gracilis]|uniref:Uncharacterized protein n=1 Tax=Nepenthes gracilis TaxID=150966 RepID=A0AAD3S0Z7_NEPGR|nr:hypothetical protein Nepgr_004141 [Nepenthes gracilis]